MEPKSLALAILHLYPELKPDIDFVVVSEEDIQWIAKWNNEHPEPSDADLEAAWEDYLANPPEKPLSELELMQKAIDDLILGGML